MASNSGIQQRHFQTTNPNHCKECGIFLNSAESLEVHVQYHKENLLHKWAAQAATSHAEETNNNNTKSGVKREFIPVAAAADSSDAMMKKSPEYGSRATPDTSVNFGHPPTPQSFHSGSSPYQNHDNFSPGFQSYQPIKTERASPHYPNYPNYSDNQFYNMDASSNQPGYSQEYQIHKVPSQTSNFRYHPYQQQTSYDRNSQPQVSSSSPAYPPQPTPSPSPKQCDKCGCVCESASLLIEHLNTSHPPTPSLYISGYPQGQHMFNHAEVKTEEDPQSEILDLDSHKVHQVYQQDEEKQRLEAEGSNPHSVTTMLSSWPQQKTFPQENHMFINGPEPVKLYRNGATPNMKLYEDQKMFQPMHSSEYITNGVTTTSPDGNQAQPYRPFEHLPPQPTPPVITSTQVPNAAPANAPAPPKGANWKSNEARRPKTYNCTACNKWFTSSGHLKRHYNTTLHKNAVKSSGQPDPAALPISSHHHPARDATTSRDGDHSPGGNEDSRSEDGVQAPTFERSNLQSIGSPYERQPTPGLHHPAHNNLANSSMSGGSPPNGEAGPSVTNLDSRGLLSLTSTPPAPYGFNMSPMMAMENSHQFQMYPNGSAPHVMQLMATTTNNLNTSGESLVPNNQPLPSFAQIQTHRGVLVEYGMANVGGVGPVTTPFYYHHQDMYRSDEDYKITILAAVENPIILAENPNNNNIKSQCNNNKTLCFNNNVKIKSEPLDDELNCNVIDDLKYKFESQPGSPEKAHIKRDYEEGAGSPLISSTVQVKQPGVHKCFDCDKMFNKACYLTQHNKTFHSGDKPYKCTRCGKRFSCETVYQEHLSKHAGDKPYKCDLCPKQFNHKTDLRRHVYLHTGQKPYACDTCGKTFIRKDHMLKHCETHTRKPHAASKVAAVR